MPQATDESASKKSGRQSVLVIEKENIGQGVGVVLVSRQKRPTGFGGGGAR